MACSRRGDESFHWGCSRNTISSSIPPPAWVRIVSDSQLSSITAIPSPSPWLAMARPIPQPWSATKTVSSPGVETPRMWTWPGAPPPPPLSLSATACE